MRYLIVYFNTSYIKYGIYIIIVSLSILFACITWHYLSTIYIYLDIKMSNQSLRFHQFNTSFHPIFLTYKDIHVNPILLNIWFTTNTTNIFCNITNWKWFFHRMDKILLSFYSMEVKYKVIQNLDIRLEI